MILFMPLDVWVNWIKAVAFASETEIATDSSTKRFKALVVSFSVCSFSEQRWMPAGESGVYLIILYHSLLTGMMVTLWLYLLISQQAAVEGKSL